MLTPLDIQNKEFGREFRGYSMQEVDEFLNLVIDGYERLYKENMEAKDSITKLNESLKQYKNLENTLQSALVVAQSASEQVQKNAEEKAENIVADANNRAKEIIANSFEEVKKLEYRYEELKRSIDVYRAKMTALLESQLGILKKVETSDSTFAEIQGMREAVEEIEAAEREIEEKKAAYIEETVAEEPIVEEETAVEEDFEEAPVEEQSAEEEVTEAPAETLVHDFNTKEIEFLLNSNGAETDEN